MGVGQLSGVFFLSYLTGAMHFLVVIFIVALSLLQASQCDV